MLRSFLEIFVVLAIGQLSLMLENMLRNIVSATDRQVEIYNRDIFTTQSRNRDFSRFYSLQVANPTTC